MCSSRRLVTSGSPLEPEIGFSRAVPLTGRPVTRSPWPGSRHPIIIHSTIWREEGRDVPVRVWDLATAAERTKLTGHDSLVRSVAVTADGTTAVSGGNDGTVRVWDLASGKQIARWTGDHAITCIALSSPPFTMAVCQRRAQPYLLEFRGQPETT